MKKLLFMQKLITHDKDGKELPKKEKICLTAEKIILELRKNGINIKK